MHGEKCDNRKQEEKLKKTFSCLRDSGLYFDQNKKAAMMGKLLVKLGKEKGSIINSCTQYYNKIL